MSHMTQFQLSVMNQAQESICSIDLKAESKEEVLGNQI